MKIIKVAAVSAIAACIITTTAFAASVNSQNKDINGQQSSVQKDSRHFEGGRRMPDALDKGGFMGQGIPGQQQDPIKMLEDRKAQIQTMLKDGKITQEKADSEIARIEQQIKDIQAFNAMTLDQKKEKLTGDFKANLDKQVADGRLTQEKADKMLKDYTDRLANWDGTGKPGFGMPGDMNGREPDRGPGPDKGGFKGPGIPGQQQDPVKMPEDRKAQMQTMMKDGKITQEKADSEIARIDQQIKDIQAFSAMTLDQKKEKLTGDFKANLDKQVANGRLTQEKADKMLKDYTDRLANWDGTGNPGFGMPGFHKGGRSEGDKART